eukprot:gene4616-9171_t
MSDFFSSSPLSPNGSSFDCSNIHFQAEKTPLHCPISQSTQDESTNEKIERELEESENLARSLMEEESMNAYQMQLAYMRDNCDHLNPEELEALQIAFREATEDPVGFGMQVESEDTNSSLDSQQDESEEWSYDRLLALGQAMGDVKTERWKNRAALLIGELEVLPFSSIDKNVVEVVTPVLLLSALAPTPTPTPTPTPGPDIQLPMSKRHRIEDRCSICMEPYVAVDLLVLFPCSHGFHETCGKEWGHEHNSCPVCKTKIAESPLNHFPLFNPKRIQPVAYIPRML